MKHSFRCLSDTESCSYSGWLAVVTMPNSDPVSYPLYCGELENTIRHATMLELDVASRVDLIPPQEPDFQPIIKITNRNASGITVSEMLLSPEVL